MLAVQIYGMHGIVAKIHQCPSTRKELRQFIVELIPKENPNLLLIDNLQHYFTDLPDLYQTVKVLEHSLNHLHQKCGVKCKVVFAASTASLASLYQESLIDLIPGRILVTTSKVQSGTSEKSFSVQGIDYGFYVDPQGMFRIKVTNS